MAAKRIVFTGGSGKAGRHADARRRCQTARRTKRWASRRRTTGGSASAPSEGGGAPRVRQCGALQADQPIVTPLEDADDEEAAE
jgi:hypothetical protein